MQFHLREIRPHLPGVITQYSPESPDDRVTQLEIRVHRGPVEEPVLRITAKRLVAADRDEELNRDFYPAEVLQRETAHDHGFRMEEDRIVLKAHRLAGKGDLDQIALRRCFKFSLDDNAPRGVDEAVTSIEANREEQRMI